MRFCVGVLPLLVQSAAAQLPFFDFEEGEASVFLPSQDDATGQRAFVAAFATSGRRALRLAAREEDAAKTGYSVVEVRRTDGPVADLATYDRLVFDVVNLDENEKSIPVYPVVATGRVRPARSVHALAPFAVTQVTVPLVVWRDAQVDLKDVRGLSIAVSDATGSPLHFDNFFFLKKGEETPPREAAYGRTVAELKPAAEAAAVRKVEAARQRLVDRRRRLAEGKAAFLAGKGRKAPRTGDLVVAAASAMDQIRPEEPDFARLNDAGRLSIRLARGEYESVQLVAMTAGERPLRRVRAEAVGFPFPVSCRVVGYVEVKHPTAYLQAYCVPTNTPAGYARQTRPTPLGWYADPVLDFLAEADVSPDRVQSLLVTVQAPREASKGVFKGRVRVSAEGGEGVDIPLSVRVYGFEVPRVSPLPLLVNFTPFVQPLSLSWTRQQAEALRRDTAAPVNLWKRHREEWADFLAEYFIGPGTVYSPMDPKSPDVPDLDLLVREDRRGRLGAFVFGSWASKATDWEAKVLPILRHRLEQVRAAGLADRALLYAYDETEPKYFAAISNAARRCHQALPGVPLATTAYDDLCGTGTILGGVDYFTPQTPKYALDVAAHARAEGRQVWWYVACGQMAPLANFFVENPLADARLLMGAQAVRMRPDGFLYYAVAKWNQARPITSGPYTDWSPIGIRHAGGRAFDGDGVWTYCGPDGIPVPTLRLENFRDGVEDYAYAMALEGLLRRRAEQNDAWAREARALLAVPAAVMVSISEFTDNAAAVYAWRDRMAELIERECK